MRLVLRCQHRLCHLLRQPTPRLVDRLGQLLGSIDRVLAAPTPYRSEHFAELRAECLKEMAKVNAFVTLQIPEINDLLKKHNAGGMMAGRPIDIPR